VLDKSIDFNGLKAQMMKLESAFFSAVVSSDGQSPLLWIE
jgi:hypothetical protein